jgi:basic amino acid/polyamine antiporter, APA family
VRGLGLWSAAAVVVGGIIGTGIFLVPSEMARDVGSVDRVLAAWVVGGVVALFGTFCHAELGAAMPQAGGNYVYLSRGLGPMWGFLFGWTGSLITYPASMATVTAGLLRFAGFLLPSLTTPIHTWHFSLPFQSQPFQSTFTVAQPVAAIAIAVVATINYFGVRAAGRTQIVLTSLKISVLLAIVILGVALGKVGGGQLPELNASPGSGEISAILTALVSAMWAYSGYSHLGLVGSEILNPQKTIPRAAIFGVVTAISLYVLVNVVYFQVLGFSQVAGSQHVASDVAVLLVGERGAKWLTLAMMISSAGALHAQALKFPRVPYAMAHSGYFFRFAGRVQPVFHTPSGALVFEGSLAVLLVLTGTFEELLSLVVFASWTFELMTPIALIRLRTKEPGLPRPYRAWGYPWTSLVFGVTALAMTANLWLVRPVRSSIGLAAIVLGIPFFRHWRKQAADTPLVDWTSSLGAC